MVPKVSFDEKLKRYRRNAAEDYAKTIMSSPKRVPNIFSALRFPGVAIIMGDIRAGKTGLAHEISNQFHSRMDLPAVLHLPTISPGARRKIQHLVPEWMIVASKRSQWPEGSVVIYDEAAQTAHSRRSQSSDALDLDDLLAIAGQRQQLILFISHYSRKLDLNVCTAVHRLIWKRPTYAHRIWERDEMADFTMKAYDYFQGIRGLTAQRKACLVLNMDNFGFMQCSNKLPAWWNDDVSRVFRDIQAMASKGGDNS